MRTMIFGAGTDLGVHIDGASLGPRQLINDINSFLLQSTSDKIAYEDTINALVQLGGIAGAA